MVTEDYVSFEIATLLKGKSFEGEVSGYYHIWDSSRHPVWGVETYNRSEAKHLYIPAPTLQIAMKWLREVHHIFIDIDWDAQPEPKGFDNKPYFSLITNMNTNELYRGKDLPGECASYEEACETAIKYCLENLV